jgi:hypothetical protein
MASARKAKGKKSVAISDISGFKVPYKELKTTWEGFRVEPEEYDPKQPQLTPPRNVIDATALFKPRPDTDPENVEIYIGYTFDPFIPIQQRPGVGIGSLGSVGFASSIRADYTLNVTGVSGSGDIGTVTISDNEDVAVTGVAGTGAVEGFGISGNGNIQIIATGISGTGGIGNVGVETPETDAVVTGVAGTGAIGTYTFYVTTDAPVTGVSGTGAIGTESIESEITETGVAGTGAVGIEYLESEITETGVAGTGAVGTESLESEITETGVAGTGEVEGFGISGNGNIQLIVTGLAGVGGVGNTGSEVSESIVVETGVAGTGAIGTVSVLVNQAWGEGAWGSDEWGE